MSGHREVKVLTFGVDLRCMWQMPLRCCLAAVLLVAALAGGTGVARAAQAPGPDALVDVREGDRAEAIAQQRTADDVPAGMQRAGRALVAQQGPLASLDADPTTQTVRSLVDLTGALSGVSGASPVRIAKDYAYTNRVALGLTAADFDTFRLASADTTADGVTRVRWEQVIDGIPAYDNGLVVDVDRAGRVISVGGAPLHEPDPNTTDPKLSGTQAIARFADRVGSDGGTDADSARLVVFDVNGLARLAWQIRHRAGATEDYDAVIDATSGRVLHRANLVKFAVNAQIFRHYPGAPQGGAQATVDIGPWLLSDSKLFGPNAYVYSDVNDSNQPAAGGSEDIDPDADSSVFSATFQTPAGRGCSSVALCSWNSGAPTSWTTNRTQNAFQAFWFVNHYHDHLASAPIGFHGFECVAAACDGADDDPVEVNTDDGAAKVGPPPGHPDSDHLNNANMSTPPEGSAPRMQMYLFSHTEFSGYRDINGGDTAEIVYHEYTHGLSSRLVHDASGVQALNSAQAGAMGEAWSDWYAMDFLTRPDPENAGNPYVNDTATPGEVDLGAYTDAAPNSIRTQPLDCPVGAATAACPAGGYTYGDFGKIGSGPEVHDDGEIWGETLWDLRSNLIANLGSVAAGSDLAEQLITGGMRRSVPEPSFLDMRDAILLEAQALGLSDPLVNLIWDTFTTRGMGYFAAAADGNDTQPVESFDPRPAPGQIGDISGTVIDALTLRPLAGATVSVPGHGTLAVTTGANGGFTISGLPSGTYTKLLVSADGGYDSAVAKNVVVITGQTTTLNVGLRRNWGATAGGGSISADTDDTGAEFACGAAALINQSQAVGWSAYNPANVDQPAPDEDNHLVPGAAPTATIKLARPVDIAAFGADPGNTCGDAPSATTKTFLIETSQDGTTFVPAYDGTSATTDFDPSDAGTLRLLTPTAGAQAVRFVRLTLLSPQNTCSNCDGRKFIDFTELAVYGNAIPTGTLKVPASATTAQAVTLDASSFTDDSAVTAYAWDFDGDGVVDRSTSLPTTSFTYATPGTYTPVVRATDDTSGSSTASASIAVTPAPVPVVPVVPHVKPKITLPRQTANRATIRVTCQTRCTVTASLKANKALAKRLKLKRWGAGAIRRTHAAGGFTIRLPVARSVLRRLRAHKIRHVTLSLAVRVRDANGLVATLARKPRIPISKK